MKSINPFYLSAGNSFLEWLNDEQNVQVSDTTGDATSTAACNKKIYAEFLPALMIPKEQRIASLP